MFLGPYALRRQKSRFRLAALWVIVVVLGSLPAKAAPAPGPSPDFPAWLAQHQAELAPFFTTHGCDMLKDGLHIIVSTAGNILLATALAGWLIDVALAWGYGTIFAPAYAKFPRALVYACGRLVLALMLTIVLMFAAMVGINAGAGLPALLIVAVLTIPAVAAQVFWVGYLYRTNVKPSLLFYIALLAVHVLIGTILIPTVFARQVDLAVGQFMNESVVPCLRTEADKAQHDAETLIARRDAAQAQVADLQARLTQDQADERDLHKRIDAQKTAPGTTFRRLVVLRAQGDLAGAGKGLAAFITKYPDDPNANAARGQLAGVSQALAAQAAAERRQEQADAQAAAVARLRLLRDAAAGSATLSEMRRALLGKTTAQVAALFGAPTETDADKWGYGRRMVYDPQSQQHHGLTVVFAEGFVQGVDYYYGDAQ
jgi:hypothetical protein